MKRIQWMIVALFALFVGLLNGCATSQDKPLAVNQMQSISSIRVVRYEQPQFRKESVGSLAAGVLTGGGLLGYMIMSGVESQGGKNMQQACSLPDFSKLVTDGLVEQMPKELPTLPQLRSDSLPVKDEFKSDSGYVLTVRVSRLGVHHAHGLMTTTTAQMLDPANKVVWQKTFTYSSKESGRPWQLSELENENGKLLREELTFSAEKTVFAFIRHIKQSS